MWQGPTQAGASHDYGRASERFVAQKRQHLGSRDVDIAGVQSPPLHDEADPNAAYLAGEGLGTTLKAVFSEGRTLCVRMARPGARRGIT